MTTDLQLDVALACFDVVDQDSLLRVLDELEKFEAQKMATCLLVGTKQDKAPEMAELFDAVKQQAQVHALATLSTPLKHHNVIITSRFVVTEIRSRSRNHFETGQR